VASVDEMKSRWVYSELGSPRWREAYAQVKGDTPLLSKAERHVPFWTLTPAEQQQLLDYAPQSSRRGLMGRLNNHSGYRLEQWDKNQISATHTIQAYGSVPYDEFLAGNHKPGKSPLTHEKLPKSFPTTLTLGRRGWLLANAEITCFSTATRGASCS
jgi:hypothetical protein